MLNGFSARLDPTSLALLDATARSPASTRCASPIPRAADVAAACSPSRASPDLEIAGLDGSGVTVALLDTGRRSVAPRTSAGACSPGSTSSIPGAAASLSPIRRFRAGPSGTATELAGIIAGTEGPGGLHGIAPGASILPIRVGGWQPDAEGGYSVYSRTDQMLAGLEAAVDPNDDGDAHDAARIALIGMAEPYAAFADGPLERAVAGAADLDVLTIVARGERRARRPRLREHRGPGVRAETALTVAAADGRLAAPTVRVFVRAGLRVLYEADVPLGGAPSGTVTADVVLVDRRTAAGGIAALFAERRECRRRTNAVLLPRAALSEDTVEEATSAGALAVLVDGPLPAGASASTFLRRARSSVSMPASSPRCARCSPRESP